MRVERAAGLSTVHCGFSSWRAGGVAQRTLVGVGAALAAGGDLQGVQAHRPHGALVLIGQSVDDDRVAGQNHGRDLAVVGDLLKADHGAHPATGPAARAGARRLLR